MRNAGRGQSVHMLLVAVGFLLAVAPAFGDESSFELLGTWYVLVHYEEQDVRGWEDKVWTFEQRGSRLVWTEYPVLSFRDDHGRFDSLASGRQVRSPGHWRPAAGQRKEIEAGPRVVARWARSKTLRGDRERGYQSRGAVNRDSASVIGYSERWEISGLGEAPLFRRVDEMSGGRAVALDGATEYRSSKPAGDEIQGEFHRDGLQTGSFRMQRVGAVRTLALDEGPGQ